MPARHLLLALVVSLAQACSNDASGLRDPVNPNTPTPPPPPATLRIDYRVTGDIPNTQITFFTATQGTTEVKTDLPWTISYTSSDLHPFLFLAAETPNDNFTTGSIDVQIFVNGVLFREARGSGVTISVSASGEVP